MHFSFEIIICFSHEFVISLHRQDRFKRETEGKYKAIRLFWQWIYCTRNKWHDYVLGWCNDGWLGSAVKQASQLVWQMVKSGIIYLSKLFWLHYYRWMSVYWLTSSVILSSDPYWQCLATDVARQIEWFFRRIQFSFCKANNLKKRQPGTDLI